MTKKKEAVEVKSIDKNVAVCQNRRTHSNRPSYCRKHGKHIGRKATCEDFR